jgi:hypothetical protein
MSLKKSNHTKPTEEQNANYKSVILKIKDKQRDGSKFDLKLAYMRGVYAKQLLDKANINKYGKRKKDEIASDLGIKQLSITRSVQFVERLSTDQLDELCNLPEPPSWRTMMVWAGTKDEAKRKQLLNDILNGNVKGNFVQHYKQVIGQAPKKVRQPTRLTAIVDKVSAQAVSFSEQLSWVNDIKTKVAEIEDKAERTKIFKNIEASVENLKGLKEKIDNAISVCDSVVSSKES